MRNIFLLPLVMILLNSGCKPQRNNGSSVSSVQASTDVKNIAVVILGDSSGIEGTIQDFKKLQDLFARLGFLVVPLEYPTKASIKAALTKAAQDMLQQDQIAMGKKQRGGTLALYITSHGDEDGGTSVAGGKETITMTDMIQSIAQGRSNMSIGNMAGAFGSTVSGGVSGGMAGGIAGAVSGFTTATGGLPLQRLVLMFDTCFSGKNANAVNQASGGGASSIGSVPPLATVTQNPLAPTSAQALPNGLLPSSTMLSVANANMNVWSGANSSAGATLQNYRGLYLSSFAIYSSQPTQTSGDTPSGGTATNEFLAIMNAALGYGPLPNTLPPAVGQTSYTTPNLIPGATSSYTTPNQNQFASVALGSKHVLVSNMRLQDIATGMLQRVSGQRPIVCAHPPQTFNDYIVDPPPGTLPAQIPPIPSGMQPTCTQSMDGITSALGGLGGNSGGGIGNGAIQNQQQYDDSEEE